MKKGQEQVMHDIANNGWMLYQTDKSGKLCKDHKGDLEDNPVQGPKLRPICPANIAPNARLDGLMARVIKILANESQD